MLGLLGGMWRCDTTSPHRLGSISDYVMTVDYLRLTRDMENWGISDHTWAISLNIQVSHHIVRAIETLQGYLRPPTWPITQHTTLGLSHITSRYTSQQPWVYLIAYGLSHITGDICDHQDTCDH